MTIVQLDNRSAVVSFQYELSDQDRNAYVCHALLREESDGGFSAFAGNLPGAASQGETIEEALDNLREAFRETVKSYLADSIEIPWANRGHEPECVLPADIERWIVIDA